LETEIKEFTIQDINQKIKPQETDFILVWIASVATLHPAVKHPSNNFLYWVWTIRTQLVPFLLFPSTSSLRSPRLQSYLSNTSLSLSERTLLVTTEKWEPSFLGYPLPSIYNNGRTSRYNRLGLDNYSFNPLNISVLFLTVYLTIANISLHCLHWSSRITRGKHINIFKKNYHVDQSISDCIHDTYHIFFYFNDYSNYNTTKLILYSNSSNSEFSLKQIHKWTLLRVAVPVLPACQTIWHVDTPLNMSDAHVRCLTLFKFFLTDMDGNTHRTCVSLLRTLPKTQKENCMTLPFSTFSSQDSLVFILFMLTILFVFEHQLAFVMLVSSSVCVYLFPSSSLYFLWIINTYFGPFDVSEMWIN